MKEVRARENKPDDISTPTKKTWKMNEKRKNEQSGNLCECKKEYYTDHSLDIRGRNRVIQATEKSLEWTS